MKKIILSIFLALIFFPVHAEEAKPLEIGVTFDWISKTQMQRDENISLIQKTIFDSEIVLKYDKKVFREEYSAVLKDKNFLKNYEEIVNGKTEDEQAYYCAFKTKKPEIMFMYAIQYKNDLKRIYYYDALGSLYFVDIYSDSYPNFPYMSYQYRVNGELVAAYYYNSAYDQYAYDGDKKFRGRWYKENYYNRRAKIIMTRSSW